LGAVYVQCDRPHIGFVDRGRDFDEYGTAQLRLGKRCLGRADPSWGRPASASTRESSSSKERVRDGVEMIVGVSYDPAFGPLVMAGLGGTTVELLGDLELRLTALSDTNVDEMLRSLRSCRLLTGYRQSPPLDVKAFEELLHRVSAMVEDTPRSPSWT
jgi:acyl-CoA synthetase (NDP forming)